MTKKPLNKLLSVILALAICSATVFGCLITVNAAGENCYAFSEGAVNEALTEATIDLTITCPEELTDGMRGGNFTLNNEGLVLKSVVTTDSSVDVEVNDTNVIFTSSTACSTLTFTLTYGFETTTDQNVKTYNVEVSTMVLSGPYDDVVSVTGTNGAIKTSCDHIVDVSGLTPAETNAEYKVYNDVICTKCGENIGTQIVPVSENGELNNVSKLSFNLYGTNLTYANDGSFVLNYYYQPVASGLDMPVLYAVVGNKLSKINGTVISDAETLTKLGLEEGAVLYSLEKVSARDIGNNVLTTLVTENAGATVWGKTESISIAKYAEDVVIGGSDIYWGEGATEEQKELNKAVAAAVISYGDAAKVALSTSKDTTKNVVYVTNDINIEDTKNFFYASEHAGTKEDPYIIETPGQWRWLAQKATYDTTYGKYFKVADGIDVLCFQLKSYVDANFGGIDGLMSKSAEEVKNILNSATDNRTQLQTANSASGNFGGHIDGNGATFVGIYNKNGGLFNGSYENVSFSNLTVSNSYFENGDFISAFVGRVFPSSSYTGYENDSIAYENIVVRDCYITSLSNVNRHRIGVLLGMESLASGIKVKMNNCLIYDNVVLAQVDGSVGAVIGDVGNFGEGQGDAANSSGNFYNSIVLGVPIFNHNENKMCRPGNFKNYYTDIAKEDNSTTYTSYDKLNNNPVSTPFWPNWYSWSNFTGWNVITADSLLGYGATTACPNLDWAGVWNCGILEDYPTLTNPNAVLKGKTVYHTQTLYEPDESLWTSGKGTAEDPYIISTPNQLCGLAQKSTFDNSYGKYFKIADGIDVMVLQTEAYIEAAGGISKWLSMTDAETYTALSNKTNRAQFACANNVSGRFAGHLDGNGATITGAYTINGALIQDVYEGASVENLTVSNCYFTNDNNYVSAVFGNADRSAAYTAGTDPYTEAPSDSYCPGLVSFEKVVVKNNYITSGITGDGNAIRPSILLSRTADYIGVKMNNCLVYGNTCYDVATTAKGGLFGGAMASGYNGIKYKTGTPNGSYTNSVILGVLPMSTSQCSQAFRPDYFTNVYTDQAKSTESTYDRKNPTGWHDWSAYTDSKIKVISAADVLGDKATTTCDLDWLNTWYVGAYGKMPTFAPVMNDFSSYKADDYADGTKLFGVSNTGLNLGSNPYMLFQFAFEDEYKTNRDKISVTFACNDKNYLANALPEYVKDEYINNVNGWTNKKGAGRYHLYRFTDIPVVDLCKDITVTATYNGGTEVNLGTFSLEGFILKKQNDYKANPNDYDKNVIDVAISVLEYSKSLNALMNAQ